MSEYWVSQAKKHCDFCKCWIAENKPSIDFHEKGKRHQENVKKKIDELKKKGVRDAKAKDEMDSDMAKMERDALAALRRDIANDPSMAAAYGVKIKERVHTVENRPEGFAEPQEEETNVTTCSTSEEAPAGCDWNETKSAEGYTYYWHKVTGETTWTKPEGYLPPSERKRKKKKKKNTETVATLEGASTKTSRDTTTNGKSEVTSTTESIPSTQGKVIEKRPVPTTKAAAVPVAQIPMPSAGIPLPSADIPLPSMEVPLPRAEPVQRDPRPSRPSAYGSWETVVQEEEPHVDLELPKSNWHIQEQQQQQQEQKDAKDAPVDSSKTKEPKIKFREKRAAELPMKPGQKAGIVFKKRKIGGAASNARKRDDD